MRAKESLLLLIFLAALAIFFLPLAYGQRLEADGDIWEESVGDLKLYLKGLIKENQELKARLSQQDNKAGESAEDRETAVYQETEIQALREAVEELRKENRTLEAKVKSPASCPDISDNLLLGCEKNKTRLERELEGARNKIKQLEKKDSCAQLEAERDKLGEQLTKVRSELESLQAARADMVKESAVSQSLLRLQLAKARESTGIPAEDDVNHELIAYKLAKTGDYAEAIVEYLEALKSNPDKKDVYFNLAVLYSKLKDHLRAAAYYKKVLLYNPGDREALLSLSKIYERLSDHSQSKHYYNLYLKAKR